MGLTEELARCAGDLSSVWGRLTLGARMAFRSCSGSWPRVEVEGTGIMVNSQLMPAFHSRGVHGWKLASSLL